MLVSGAGDEKPWGGEVPHPLPFEPWCPIPSATAAATDDRNITGSNGQACFCACGGIVVAPAARASPSHCILLLCCTIAGGSEHTPSNDTTVHNLIGKSFTNETASRLLPFRVLGTRPCTP